MSTRADDLKLILGFPHGSGARGAADAEEKQLGMVAGAHAHAGLINDVSTSRDRGRSARVPARRSGHASSRRSSPRRHWPGKGLEPDVVRSAAARGERPAGWRDPLDLLSNDIKFTDRGAVTLTVDVVGENRSNGGAAQSLRLRVADTGIGITAADLDTLFQPFRQLDNGLARQSEGTGLGLAICRRLATLLGGEISAASEPARGSVFALTLPLEEAVA